MSSNQDIGNALEFFNCFENVNIDRLDILRNNYRREWKSTFKTLRKKYDTKSKTKLIYINQYFDTLERTSDDELREYLNNTSNYKNIIDIYARNLISVPGVNEKNFIMLYIRGYHLPENIYSASDKELLLIPGIDEAFIKELRNLHESDSPLEGMDRSIQKEHLGGWLSQLNEREQKIMRLRFGLDGEEPLTLAEIGRQINVSRERVRQLEAKAILKLRVMTTHQNAA